MGKYKNLLSRTETYLWTPKLSSWGIDNHVDHGLMHIVFAFIDSE